MVNKENMRLVVAALRSGRYLQGRGRLKQIFKYSISYCCMGVMCEVAMEHGVVLDVARHPLGEFSTSVSFDGSSAFLRRSVLEWLGLDVSVEGDGDPVVGMYGNEKISASYANDELGWDFERIAASMEEYYKLLENDDDVKTVAPAPQD